MMPRVTLVLALALAVGAACRTAMNYTAALGPRYAGGPSPLSHLDHRSAGGHTTPMMSARPGLAAGMSLAVMLCATSAWGQRPHRTGFWLEISSGPGAVRVGCGGCPGVTTAGGTSGSLRLGGMLSDKVMMGVEAYGFTDETFQFSDNDPATVADNASIAAIVLWYPWHGGVFLKGGVGLANGTFTVSADSSATGEASGTGVGMTLGLGLDIPFSRRFAFTANAAAYITAIGDVTIAGTRVDDVIAEMYQLSIGLTIR